ncbi:MAG: hypothetical protein ABH833_04570 [Parcubacteria group bacterium]
MTIIVIPERGFLSTKMHDFQMIFKHLGTQNRHDNMTKNTIVKRVLVLILLFTIVYSIIPVQGVTAGLFDGVFKIKNKDATTENSSATTLESAYNHIGETITANTPTIIGDTSLASVFSPITDVVTNSRKNVVREIYVPATAYNSVPWQTDNTPFISANGTRVYWGMAAANFLPFGTEVKIPDLYGDKIFTVHDRMNKRYDYRIDLWFDKISDAKEFGVRTVRVEVLGS